MLLCKIALQDYFNLLIFEIIVLLILSRRRGFEMFELSATIVYPGYGVAKLSREVAKKIGENEFFFYELNFINKDVKILVPKVNLELVGIRLLSEVTLIQEILFSFLEEYKKTFINDIAIISWNRRSKEYQGKIRKGDIRDLGNILKELKYIEQFKALSFGEKAVLLQVESLFCEEVSEVYKKNFGDIVVFINKFLQDCLSGKVTGYSKFLREERFLDFDSFLNFNETALG